MPDSVQFSSVGFGRPCPIQFSSVQLVSGDLARFSSVQFSWFRETLPDSVQFSSTSTGIWKARRAFPTKFFTREAQTGLPRARFLCAMRNYLSSVWILLRKQNDTPGFTYDRWNTNATFQDPEFTKHAQMEFQQNRFLAKGT